MQIIAQAFLLAGSLVAELPWQKRHAEGWAWYHDFEKPPKEEKQEQTPKDPIICLKLAKEEMERALATAMLEPSKANVLEYMFLQHKWSAQSREFSKFWQYNLLEHPEVASQLPTSQYGVRIRKEIDAKARSQLIHDLAQDNILLFFYEGGNPYSREFSKVVTTFAKQNQWAVKPVSIDSLVLKEFPRSICDSSIAKEMNVHVFPALFLVNVKTQSAVPIAYGMVTISQVEENIVMQYTGESTW
jgi:conjugal transfer pilus assembly protein TraF